MFSLCDAVVQWAAHGRIYEGYYQGQVLWAALQSITERERDMHKTGSY